MSILSFMAVASDQTKILFPSAKDACDNILMATPEEANPSAVVVPSWLSLSEKLLGKDDGEVETFIGHEAPVPLSADFSLVVAKVLLPRGEQGLIGIVGPKRMKYAKNISLLEHVKKLLVSGLVIVLIIYM